MSNSVYIRPLRVEDALISYEWRNNPRIWKHTGSRPDKHITPEIEVEWIKEVLQRTNEKRYAICKISDDQYIGNVFLTDIADDEAQIHIFLGDIRFWGNSNASEAIHLLQDLAFTELGIQTIHATIRENNNASVALAKRSGFVLNGKLKDDLLDLICTREMFNKKDKPDKSVNIP